MSLEPRRLRRGALLRNFVADLQLDLNHFIYPVFVKNGTAFRKPISSMPGIFQLSPDLALEEISNLSKKGIKNFMFFGVIEAEHKDPIGSIACRADNPVNKLTKLVREAKLDVLITADLCYCEYTSHGHCGVLSEDPELTVDNEKTLEILAEQAIGMAQHGADVIAPSGMMDGMVSAIRAGLDSAGFRHIPILSYSIKYASNLYGPFREAAEGAPSFGNRKGYQMDFRRSSEWETEAQLDIEEGADMLMVKPGMYYLDVLSGLKQMTNLPVGAYQVSGEYAMIHAAAQNGWLDLKSVALESLYCLKRAGADFIITYFAKDLPDWLEK